MQQEQDPSVLRHAPHTYMPMLETAEIVARRYGIPREAQDAYALASQQRTAAAQAAGRFDAEIVPLATTMTAVDRDSGAVSGARCSSRATRATGLTRRRPAWRR